MKSLSISALKKKIFLRDLLTSMKRISTSGLEGNLIDVILIDSEYYDFNDPDNDEWYEDKYIGLEDLYKKIKKTDLLKLKKNLFDGKLLSKIASSFELIFYFEFQQECHYLIFSKYNKTYFHIYVLKDKNKPISKSNQLIYNCVLNATKRKLNKHKFFELIMKFNESVEDRFMEENKSIDYEEREKIWEKVAYTDSKGINQFNLYKEGRFKQKT